MRKIAMFTSILLFCMAMLVACQGDDTVHSAPKWCQEQQDAGLNNPNSNGCSFYIKNGTPTPCHVNLLDDCTDTKGDYYIYVLAGGIIIHCDAGSHLNCSTANNPPVTVPTPKS